MNGLSHLIQFGDSDVNLNAKKNSLSLLMFIRRRRDMWYFSYFIEREVILKYGGTFYVTFENHLSQYQKKKSSNQMVVALFSCVKLSFRNSYRVLPLTLPFGNMFLYGMF